MRHLVLVLGDQLNHDSAAFDGFDPAVDAVWMSETPEELTHVWCHKLRIAFFLSAMRQFRDELRERGVTVHYASLAAAESDDVGHSFAERLAIDVRKHRPSGLIIAEPGDHRVRTQLQRAAIDLGVPLQIGTDRSFLCTTDEFAIYAGEHKALLLETFYRWMRRRHRILIDNDGTPAGGRWNFDKENRHSFGRSGPERLSPAPTFAPDQITEQVIALVDRRYPAHPGSLARFELAVTRTQALSLLHHFIEHRLDNFGPFQDAMWTGEPLLFHSRLSAALNVKLISAREVIEAALAAATARDIAPNSIEGFVRQILGWREFMRGVYWLLMPGYADRNSLQAQQPLPGFYWNAETDMNCMHQCISQVIDEAYAHHIQRLMVLGNFALLYGVNPSEFHQWHMAMYTDAVDWVSLPNALGMSQHADGGVVGTKPYVAGGNYINKMSNYCSGCRYDPKKSIGDDACPFTTLYWDFMHRHRDALSKNPRMRYPLQYLASMPASDKAQIMRRAENVRAIAN